VAARLRPLAAVAVAPPDALAEYQPQALRERGSAVPVQEASQPATALRLAAQEARQRGLEVQREQQASRPEAQSLAWA
jgi:hypothetical protein